MSHDIEVAKQFTARPIQEIADKLNIDPDHILPYGKDIAKVSNDAVKAAGKRRKPGKLILVSATTPTAAGEGKTTTSIGIAQAFDHIGESVCLALREPSLGPCLGMKGGACGGGYAQVMPMDRINLHFTGDFHAITSANNLLSASIDNHIFHGNELGIDQRQIVWRRCMDMNDRSLRNIVVGLGGKMQGFPREGGFDITAASEIMAILCLSEDANDLRRRLNRILVAYRADGTPVYAESLGITGAMMALLRDAIMPNLVQTLEGTPALIHGGPFANIAHGCNSIIATKMAMALADYTITEAGFGFDLGAEKFFDIKCRKAGLDPDAVVLVTTIRALKSHGGVEKDDLEKPDPDAVYRGLENLDKHIESVQKFGKTPIVAINEFVADTEDEIEIVKLHCQRKGLPVERSRHYTEGGKGSVDLAKRIIEMVAKGSEPFTPLYELESPVVEKIRHVAHQMYGARSVAFTKEAERDLKLIEYLELTDLPICIAKAPSSLSDDPTLRGRPRDFEVTVRGLQVNRGAGFLVVLTGNIMRMPGLPRVPEAMKYELEEDGTISGMS
jgi:formate--tetrahydrofolate ligase